MSGYSPYVRRKRLGSELRRHRLQRKMKLTELAAESGVPKTKISRLELGQIRPDIADVMNLLDVFQVDDTENRRLVGIARQANERGWWKSYSGEAFERHRELADLEYGARRIREVAVTLVPGLLQTEEYIRTRYSHFSVFQDGPIDDAIEARLKRQELILGDSTRRYEVVIDEGALYRRTCPPQVMVPQLERLLEVGEQNNVHLLILPFGAEVFERTGLLTGFTIFDYADPADPSMVFLETETVDYVFGDEEDGRSYDALFAELQYGAEQAGGKNGSTNLIAAAIKRIQQE